MEIAAFSERVLFGSTLEEKLEPPGSLTDNDPGRAIDVPTAPERPRILRLGHDNPRAPFPSLASFEDDRMRGRALHFFANHELLAAELMALCLLRFVDAPKKFRLGLAQTIVDEQRHLGLYKDRMEALSVELGEVPVNNFFWRTVKDVVSPADFVARMSLTFEQANLDFSRHYEAAFRAVGDDVTARLMNEVYEDEIRHVRHGVRWFDEWRDDGETLWSAYVARLQPPFSPMRAKGPSFDVEGRRRAGFPEAYIERVRLYRASKGRAPQVFVFNATVEEEIRRPSSYTPAAGAKQVEQDLAFVMAYLAKIEDVVVAPPPSAAFLERLLDVGFEIPRVVRAVDDLSGETIDDIVPWGESPRIDRLRATLERPPADAPDRFDKSAYADLFGATRCSTLSEIEAAIDGPVVVKAVYGASGRHQRRIDGTLDDNTRGFLRGLLERFGAVLVEPWCDRVRDFGALIDVGRRRPLVDVLELLVDERGAYQGHRRGAANKGLPRSVAKDFFPKMRATAETVAARLTETGFRGPAGFDGFVYRSKSDDLMLRPIVDLNARHTMGHIARRLFLRVASQRPAVWRHVSLGEAKRRGFADLHTLVDDACRTFPLEMTDGRISDGVLPTTDPTVVTRMVTLLFVGDATQLACETCATACVPLADDADDEASDPPTPVPPSLRPSE